MTGKSSWVHSRTQGSIPMLFLQMVKCTMVIASSACTLPWAITRPRAMVTLSSLLLLWEWPNYGTVSNWICVCYFQTMKLPLLENLFCNNFKHSDVFDEGLWTGCNCEWWPLNLLRSWLYVRIVVWNPSRFHGLPGLYGFKLDGLTVPMVTIRLNLL